MSSVIFGAKRAKFFFFVPSVFYKMLLHSKRVNSFPQNRCSREAVSYNIYIYYNIKVRHFDKPIHCALKAEGTRADPLSSAP